MELASRLNPLLVILAATVITAFQMFSQPLSTPAADAVYYLRVADNLNVHGVFSDALAAEPGSPPAPNIFITPLYPAFLTVIAKISPEFAAYATCVVDGTATGARTETLCPHRVGMATVVQCALAVLAGLLVYVGASLVCGKRRHGWVAMFLVLATGEYAYYGTLYLTENLVLPLFTLVAILLVQGWRSPAARVWLATGAVLGLLTLVRPSFLYLAVFVLLCQLILLARGGAGRAGAAGLAAGVFGFMALVGPWMLHNWMVHGVIAITQGYAADILAQRVAYNAMTLGEWLVSWIYWLPDFGDSLAASLFPPELYVRLTFEHPESFYRVGRSHPADHFGDLLRVGVLDQFGKHLMVTLPLAMRGLWAGGNVGAVMFLLFVPVVILSIRRRRYDLAVFALPAWFMLGFHAFVSVNVARYNLVLLPGFATGAAVALVWMAERIYGVGAGRARAWRLGSDRTGE